MPNLDRGRTVAEFAAIFSRPGSDTSPTRNDWYAGAIHMIESLYRPSTQSFPTGKQVRS